MLTYLLESVLDASVPIKTLLESGASTANAKAQSDMKSQIPLEYLQYSTALVKFLRMQSLDADGD